MSYLKHYLYKKQYSTDGGQTWEDVEPIEYTTSGDPVAVIYTTLEECENDDVPHDYSKDYFTIIPKNNGTIKMTRAMDGNQSFYYSYDGNSWLNGKQGTDIKLNNGTPLMLRGTLTPNNHGVGTFVTTTQFDVVGNVMSLVYNTEFQDKTSFPSIYKSKDFKELFSGCTSLVSAENLILPAPTLSSECYANMFRGCTNLKIAPQLPSTTLSDSCYYYMFNGCTSLTTAPELLATTLVSRCYNNMFYECPSLNYIKCLATDISAELCLYSWVNGVARTGTFVKAASMSDWTRDENGIPEGWTIEEV